MTGSGTAIDPYVIWDVNDLQDMANGAPYASNAYYELGCDIDAAATTGWNWNAGRGVFEGWQPRSFSGHFDGRRHIIRNLYLNRYPCGEAGLFARLTGGATVQNVFILDVDLTARRDEASCWIGGLAGYVNSATITRTYISGIVTGTTCDTILPARSRGGSGGLIGYCLEGRIEICATDVNIWHTGITYGIPHAGGIVAYHYCDWDQLYISNTYSRGPAGGNTGAYNSGAGGILGAVIFDGGTPTLSVYIDNCYATGALSGGGSGGIIGNSNDCARTQVTDSFWDVDTTGVAVTCGGGTGLNTPPMKTLATFTAAGWDFVTIWDIDGIWNDGYPFHRWDPPPVIRLTLPNGGEIWYAGSTYTILWTHTHSRAPGTHVLLELLKGGVLDEIIIASTPIGPPGGGNYNWPIAPGKPPGHDYRVRVTSITYPYMDTSDDDFKIRDPTVGPPAPAVATLPATGVR